MSEQTPATPVPAATIVLLRDSDDGLETFMVVRHHEIDFASGALVFPGGKADKTDFDPALAPRLYGAHTNTDLRAAQVAAIREAFEECGILLARKSGQAALISAELVAQFDHEREPLNRGELQLTDFLQRHDLVLACDQLVHFAHWITPPMMPKRFDTHFFLAHAPEDQVAAHDGYESVDSVWITPATAVAEAESGTRTVIFPTLRNIEKLATFENADDAMAKTRTATIVPVLPWTEKRDDGMWICIPPEAGYAVSAQKLPPRTP